MSNKKLYNKINPEKVYLCSSNCLDQNKQVMDWSVSTTTRVAKPVFAFDD